MQTLVLSPRLLGFCAQICDMGTVGIPMVAQAYTLGPHRCRIWSFEDQLTRTRIWSRDGGVWYVGVKAQPPRSRGSNPTSAAFCHMTCPIGDIDYVAIYGAHVFVLENRHSLRPLFRLLIGIISRKEQHVVENALESRYAASEVVRDGSFKGRGGRIRAKPLFLWRCNAKNH